MKGTIVAYLDNEDHYSQPYHGGPDRYFHLTVSLYRRQFADGEWSELDAQAARKVEGIQIQCQADNRPDQAGDSYAWEVQTEDRHFRLHDLERIVKVMRAIDKKLQRWQTEWGHPATFGEYVRRVLRALPVSVRVHDRIEGSFRKGSEWPMTDGSTVVCVVDSAIARFHKEHTKKAA